MNNQLEDLLLPNGQYWQHCKAEGSDHFSFQCTCLDISAINQQGRMEESPNEASIDEDDPIIWLQSAWSVRIDSSLVPEHACVYVRSNRWPGLE